MRHKKLSTYLGKRDFAQTPEPGEAAVAAAKQLRFVVQKHAARRLHYDLRLELDGVFKSWAVTRGPSLDPAVRRLAVQVEDHPLAYGDFEGTIPQGQYGGGTVQLWDRGYWIPQDGQNPRSGLRAGDLKFSLAGTRLHGGWVLIRMRDDRGDKRHNWLLIKHRDAEAATGDALLVQDRSIASGRSMRQIAAGKGRAPQPFMRSRAAAAPAASVSKTSGPATARTVSRRAMPDFVPPQLCRSLELPPHEVGWAHEVKFDGYRMQLRVEERMVVLKTRKGLDWTARFRSIASAAGAFPDCIIDAEVVALDRRHVPSFAALQMALSEDKAEDLILFAFDLLFVGREDLRGLPLAQRKERLRALLEKADPGPRIRFVQHFQSTADTVLKSACKMDLEGIVSKRLDAPYSSGRSATWTKAKCRAGHEVVLGGWSSEAGEIRSLLAGVYRGGQLVYVGRIGTGFGREAKRSLRTQLRKSAGTHSPFEGNDALRQERNVHWLKPALVAEIEFAGWTASGMIRQAAFKGLRLDKPAEEVVAEMPTPVSDGVPSPDALRAQTGRASKPTSRPRGAKRSPAARRQPGKSAHKGMAGEPESILGVTISKPDKALWPDAGDATPVSKHDLAKYFEEMGHWILPHVAGRPCSLVRAPDGVNGEQFFQRHAMAGMSNLLELIKVKGERAPYVQINRIEALVAVAQIGALEIHPWNCAPGNPELPSRLVFDLDPGPGVAFAAVVSAALELNQRLGSLNLRCFCKTTGGKGLHVVTPFTTRKSSLDWATAKTFAQLICSQMAADSPRRYLVNMSKSQRQGRIFLDYLRNDRTATAVSVLSPRARAGALVSMPLTWAQLRKGLDPKRFTIRTAAALLRASHAWDGYQQAACSLQSAMRAAARPARGMGRRNA